MASAKTLGNVFMRFILLAKLGARRKDLRWIAGCFLLLWLSWQMLYQLPSMPPTFKESSPTFADPQTFKDLPTFKENSPVQIEPVDKQKLSPTPTLVKLQKLHEGAKAKHEKALASQSKTLAAAKAEYVRRYEMQPPPGFDDWYQYATQNDSPLIDDYDLMMSNIRPFQGWFREGCDLREERDNVTAATTEGLVGNMFEFCVRDHKLVVDTKVRHADTLTPMLSDLLQWIPDICLDINPHDEPRSNISYSDRAEMIRNGRSKDMHDDMCSTKQLYRSERRRNIWHLVQATCPPDSPAVTGREAPHRDAEFITNWYSSTELCQMPRAPDHGGIQSPNSLFASMTTRPVLSMGSWQSFSDILFPTFWRYRFQDDKDKIDTWPWESKANKAYWRGSTTSGRAEGSENWKHFHRQRAVKLANESRIGWDDLDRVDPSKKLPKLMDAQFTKIVLCGEEACKLESEEFQTAEYAATEDAFQNKIVLDFDGTGLSGRFYYLLRSNSMVMKMGLITEWHDDYIQPWLHYVPISVELTELKDVLETLLSEEGQALAKAIADEGRRWANAALRREDMKVFMLRLLLELGRREYV